MAGRARKANDANTKIWYVPFLKGEDCANGRSFLRSHECLIAPLIDLVKNEERLWKKGHPEYFDLRSCERRAAWASIMAELHKDPSYESFTLDEVKATWNYMVQRVRMVNADGEAVKAWYIPKMAFFAEEHRINRRSVANTDESTDPPTAMVSTSFTFVISVVSNLFPISPFLSVFKVTNRAFRRKMLTRLIELVKAEERLWNEDHPEYFDSNSNQRLLAWTSIVAELQKLFPDQSQKVTYYFIKNKWNDMAAVVHKTTNPNTNIWYVPKMAFLKGEDCANVRSAANTLGRACICCVESPDFAALLAHCKNCDKAKQ